jgi:hypothetical protein
MFFAPNSEGYLIYPQRKKLMDFGMFHFSFKFDLLRITDKRHLAITSVPVTQVPLLNGEIARKYNESSNSLR